MRAFWKINSVVSLKLEENLFSLAQMANHSAFMCFFDVFNETDSWKGTDLNKSKQLFCVPVGNIILKNLGQRRVPADEVTPSAGPFPRYYIDPLDNSEGYRLRREFMWRGGRLVDCGSNLETDPYYAETVVASLTIEKHREEILQYELVNMYGDKDVQMRLIGCRTKGENQNPMKKDLFPGL
jgi:hypothetical protein